MKKFLLLFIFIISSGFLNEMYGQISFSGCGNADLSSSYELNESGNVTDAGITRTIYKSDPSQGDFGELIIIKWDAASDKWEIYVNAVDGDDDSFNDLLYVSNVATYPNPPNIAIGNWTSQGEYACDPLDAANGELSGDVEDTPPDLPLTVTISTTVSSPVNFPFEVTITFSEAVTGFTLDDINGTNSIIHSLQIDDNIFRVTVSPESDGVVTIQVPADVAQNIGENGNSSSNTLSVTYDGTAPKIDNVNVPASGYYQNDDILTFKVNFSEGVTVDQSGGTPYLGLVIGSETQEAPYSSGSGTDALTFSYTVMPGDEDLDGIAFEESLRLNGGSIYDAAGNNASLTMNNIGDTNNLFIYSLAPSVTLSGTPSPNGPFTLTATFNEAVTGLTVGDINASNVTISSFQTMDSITYTALVTPIVDGAVNLYIPEDVAVNIADIGNSASNTISYDYDKTAPVTPEGLDAVPGDEEVVLNWTANTENDLANYTIYGGTTANPSTLLTTVDAPMTSYTHSNLTNGTLYYYRISANDTVGNESGKTVDISARPKSDQSISFDALTDRTYGDAPLVLTATTSSGLTVGYTSSDPSIASISGNELTIHQAGTVEITANQPGNDSYNSATDVTQTLIINPKSVTIIAQNKTKVYGEGDPPLSYRATGFVNGDDESILTGALSRVAGETVGTYAINMGTLDAGVNYAINFTGEELTITPATISGITFTDVNFTYDGTAKSLAIAGALPAGTSVAYSNNSRTNVGTQEVTATITGSNFTELVLKAAITITKIPLTVLANAGQTKVYGSQDPTLTYTANGFINDDDESIITGVLSRYSGEDAGIYEITLGSLSAGDNYEISFEGANFEITKADQQIVWEQSLSFGCDTADSVELLATATSGLPITYEVSNTSIAAINGSVLTKKSSGSAKVTALQAGDINHNPATSVIKSITISQSGLIRQHWEDVLVFDNSSGSFVSYQWFKDGVAVPEATAQYYNENSALSGIYYVAATTESGEVITSCPLELSGEDFSNTFRIVPNPVKTAAQFSIECSYDQAQLNGATLGIFDISGRLLETVSVTGTSTQLSAPIKQGVFIIVLTLSNGEQKTANLLVN